MYLREKEKKEREEKKEVCEKVFIIWESFEEYANERLLLTVNITATAKKEHFNVNTICEVNNIGIISMLSRCINGQNMGIFAHV